MGKTWQNFQVYIPPYLGCGEGILYEQQTVFESNIKSEPAHIMHIQYLLLMTLFTTPSQILKQYWVPDYHDAESCCKSMSTGQIIKSTRELAKMRRKSKNYLLLDWSFRIDQQKWNSQILNHWDKDWIKTPPMYLF